MLASPIISINEDMKVTYRSITVQIRKIDPFRQEALVFFPPYNAERWIPTKDLIIENALHISSN